MERTLSKAVRRIIVASVFFALWAIASVYFANSSGRTFVAVADVISGFVWPAVLAVVLNRWLGKQAIGK